MKSAEKDLTEEQIEKLIKKLLAKFRDPRDVTPFNKLSYDECYVVSKYYIIHELVKIGKPVAPFVMELVNDENHLVRELAIKTLGELNEPMVTPEVVKALEDPKRRVRAAALDALKTITKLSFGSYARRNHSYENQEKVVKKWKSWWTENEKPFMVGVLMQNEEEKDLVKSAN